jgi:aminoglycoside phosphotransferase (APT) family kinase protein
VVAVPALGDAYVNDRRASALDPELAAWVEAQLGRRVVASTRTTTGGSRTTWLVDLDGSSEPPSVVVRVEGDGSFTGTEVSLAREIVAFKALENTPVPVPKVYATRADGAAVIVERLAGTDDLATYSAEDRAAIIDEFAAALAEMHRLDPHSLDLPGFEMPSTPEDHAGLDIAMWRRLAALVEPLDPLITYCGAWLMANAPTRVTKTAFVQGDTGPGNFMADAGRLTGLVDMEFAHIGDPMDDVAWVMMRLRGAATPSEFLASYARHGGVDVDDDLVEYYRLAVDFRCAVTTSLAVGRGGGARGWAPYVLQTQRYLDGIAVRIASSAGVELPHADAAVCSATERTAMYDQVLSTIRTAARALDDPELATATRNDQILVHYLRAHDQIGLDLAAEDATDQRSILGSELDGRALTERASAAGEQGDPEVLRYLLRRHQRNRQLWSTLLDR